MKNLFCFAIILLALTIFCDHEKGILGTGMFYDGDGYLTIVTEKDIYRWDETGSNHFLLVQGDLKNKSGIDYYAHILQNHQQEYDIFHITNGMPGFFERYDETTDSWKENYFDSLILWATEDITIKKDIKYSLIGVIYPIIGVSTGKFRFRINYYTQQDPPPGTEPFVDYSNVFEIR